MVTRLPRPEVDDDDYLDRVVAARRSGKNAEYFLGIREDWKQRVRDYVARSGNPEGFATWADVVAHKSKFHNLYTGCKDNSAHGLELMQLREGKPQFCPACGEAGQPNTLDHHLPKESYPEFSITPVNLFPMCDTCQGFKGTLTVDGSGRRYFIHPYFDDFAHDRLIEVEFQSPFTAPSMKIRVRPELDPSAFELTTRHLEKLQIERRLSHFMRDEYRRLLRLAKSTRDSAGDVRVNLQIFAKFAAMRSMNTWDHVWYASVLEDEDLTEYLTAGELPEFV
ncbi:hypothetical protein VDG09_03155 [Xanthomonas campestris pv. raphani]|uniref:hypothetical protein n=1 Tax=Xanthomonas campestris TaxID=339 RepID=UPI002B2304B6|nr:hypothetical protein [Xanthomonas campestris]MEA9826662.1 hypothetical protein [Xanthomonas campestris pv. raphani]